MPPENHGTPPWLAALLLQPNNRLRHRLGHGLLRLAALSPAARRRVRAVGRQLPALGLILALGGAFFAARPPAFAAGIVVDGITCTLVEAIKAANTDAPSGGCTAGSGADLLTLTADVTLTSSAGQFFYAPTGLPAINGPLTIAGNGHTIQRDPAAPPFRLMAINNSIVTLSDLTLNGGDVYSGGAFYMKRGNVTLNDVVISGNTAESSGGGIHQYRGRLTLTDSTITGNSAGQGGGVYTYRGGLYLSGSTISGNSAADGLGGGLYITYDSTVTISDTTLSANTAINGGGLYISASKLDLTDSLISGNDAETGGGIAVYAGQITITTTTISDNTAVYNGGGLYAYESPLTLTRSTISNNSAEYGGGLYSGGTLFDPLTIANTTFSGNSAVYGGGVANTTTADLVNVTITSNEATVSGGGLFNTGGILTLQRSLLSGNDAPAGAELWIKGGLLASNGDNVFSHTGRTTATALPGFALDTTDFNASSDAAAVPLAGILAAALAGNGGPTLTHTLPPGSPAIDRAPSADCAFPPVDGQDQRGRPRPVDGNGAPGPDDCDAGALEFNPADPTVTPTPTATLPPTQTLTPSPTVTGTITVTATATASPTATPSPTSSPTATPSPTATASSTTTPSPTASPTSTATPSPTATPSATATQSPTPAPIYLPLILDEPSP
jgi:hypothetical protein